MIAAICACSQSVPSASRDSMSEWETGTPVAGRPDAFKVSSGEILELPPRAVLLKNCVFVGNVPPKCGNTGAYRRFYSQPNVSYLVATWDVSPSTNLPTPAPARVHAAGYVYAEGWPVSDLDRMTSAGFAYSAEKTWFSAFLTTPAGTKFSKTRWASSSSQQLTLQLYGSATATVSATFGDTCYTPPPSGGTLCSVAISTPDPGWSATGCCIVASVVAIVERPPGRKFKNGYTWGPIEQVDCSALTPSPGNCAAPGLMLAGQRYPSDPTRVIVSEPIFPGTEVDTIDLHP
jgi:hypothetical protein